MTIEEEFLNYTNHYEEVWCKDKVQHTFRVVHFALEIGQSLCLLPEEMHLVYLASLLHDIGRFEQIRNYHSFLESKQSNHGEIGVKVLLDHSFIDRFCKTEEEKRIVLETVRYHGAFEVPPNLKEKDQKIINIVRDADKLDILNSTLDHFSMDIKDHFITESVKNDFFSHHLVHRANGSSDLDDLVSYLAFPFDFHFSYSFQYLKEHKVIEKIIMKYVLETNHQEVQQTLREMGKEMKFYINHREKVRK